MKRDIVHITSQKYNNVRNNKVYATPIIQRQNLTARLNIENNKIVAQPKIV